MIATVLGIAVLGCNLVLGIDEQPLRETLADAGERDVREAEREAVRPALEPCSRDSECVPPNGCYTPHCDTVLGACTYALCEAKGRTCAMGTCDANKFTCSEPAPYGFRSTSYRVRGLTSGCGSNPAACVAAAFPFVFIGTRNDVVAVKGDDFAGTDPVTVPISDVGTKPAQVVASGRRIWVLGAVQGQVPPYQLPIALIDAPSDPTVSAIHARTVFVSYPFPSAVAFPAPNGALFVVYNDAAQGFPTAIVTPTIAAGASFGLASAIDAGSSDASVAPSPGSMTMVRTSVAPPGAVVVASSGARLVVYRPGAVFNLIASAGTSTATAEPDLPLAAPLIAIGPPNFAQGPDGVVVIAAPVQADPPPPAPPAVRDCNCTTHERLQWVFPSAIATTTDVNQWLDPEEYINMQIPSAACHVCTDAYARPPMLATWIDRRSVLTAAPFSGPPASRAVTDVRLLGRDPLDANPKRRAQTRATEAPSGNVAVDRIALTSSNGIGYLVLADGQGNDVSFSIYDPRCDAP